nr:hypothetical protein [Mesorhizobium sp.]
MDTYTFLSTLRGLLTVHPVTVETHETGLALAERYSFSIYDVMIAAAALHAAATHCGQKICSMGWCSTKGCVPPIRFGQVPEKWPGFSCWPVSDSSQWYILRRLLDRRHSRALLRRWVERPTGLRRGPG